MISLDNCYGCTTIMSTQLPALQMELTACPSLMPVLNNVKGQFDYRGDGKLQKGDISFIWSIFLVFVTMLE